MKNIQLRFYGLGYNNYYQACILIYDEKGKLVFSGKTYNGKLDICLKKDKIYKVVATICNETITNIIIANNNEYVLYFERGILNTNTNSITLNLTDYYYENLPIERGDLIIWQE